MHQAPAQIAQPPLAVNRTEAIASTAMSSFGIGRAGIDPTRLSPDRPEMTLDLARTALVVIDPLASLVRSRRGAEQTTVRNVARLFRASEHAAITVAVSLTADRGGTSFVPELKPYVDREATIICEPHTRYSPLPRVNDSGVQLRRRRVRQIILAGFVANLRLESHLRDFLELGFEVAVVRDAIAGPELPEGQGYLAALVNFRRIADAVWTTEQVVTALGWAGPLARPKAKECTR